MLCARAWTVTCHIISLLHGGGYGSVHGSGSLYGSVTIGEENRVTGKACQRSAAETPLDRRHLERSHRA